MLDKIISFFDEDNEFKEVWELKLIKFDIDLDEEIKPYEKYWIWVYGIGIWPFHILSRILKATRGWGVISMLRT